MSRSRKGAQLEGNGPPFLRRAIVCAASFQQCGLRSRFDIAGADPVDFHKRLFEFAVLRSAQTVTPLIVVQEPCPSASCPSEYRADFQLECIMKLIGRMSRIGSTADARIHFSNIVWCVAQNSSAKVIMAPTSVRRRVGYQTKRKPIRGKKEKRQQGVDKVEIGLRIAYILARAPEAMHLGDIAKQANLPPSKAHRFLVSLCRSEIIEQDSG